MIKVDEETLNKLHQIDININTAGVGKDFQIEEDEQSSTTPEEDSKDDVASNKSQKFEPHSTLPPLAKFVPSLIVQSFQAIASTLES